MYCVATLLLPGMPKRHIVQRAIPMKGRTSLSRKERMDDLNAFVTNVEKPGAQSGTTAIESKRWGSEQPHKPERKDTMRHSLFFETLDEAYDAKPIAYEEVGDIEDCYQSNDGESGLIELRFFTTEKLSNREITRLLKRTKPATYALNCED